MGTYSISLTFLPTPWFSCFGSNTTDVYSRSK